MKRILAALAISFALVLAFFILAIIVSAVLGNSPMVLEPALARPLSLPRVLFTNIAPNFIQDKTVVIPGLEQLMFFIGNVLIYSIPIYVLLSMIARRRSSGGS